jgi:hypothetical protein
MEYEFIIVYKLSRIHVVTIVLSKLVNNSKPLSVSNLTIDVSLFSIEPIWMQEVKTYLQTRQMLKTLNLT